MNNKNIKNKKSIYIILTIILIIMSFFISRYIKNKREIKIMKKELSDHYQIDEELLLKIDNLDNIEDVIYDEIQKNYGKYLINSNDNMIDAALKTIDIYEEFERLGKEEKYRNKYITMYEEEVKHHTVLLESLVEEMYPSDDNLDYNDVYMYLIEAHTYFSIGMINKLEYMYDESKEEVGKEGDTLINIAGNVAIELGEKINQVRNTNYSIKYKANKDIPMIKNKNNN